MANSKPVAKSKPLAKTADAKAKPKANPKTKAADAKTKPKADLKTKATPTDAKKRPAAVTRRPSMKKPCHELAADLTDDELAELQEAAEEELAELQEAAEEELAELQEAADEEEDEEEEEAGTEEMHDVAGEAETNEDDDGDDNDEGGEPDDASKPKGKTNGGRTNQLGKSGRWGLVPYKTKGACAIKEYSTQKQLRGTYVESLLTQTLILEYIVRVLA